MTATIETIFSGMAKERYHYHLGVNGGCILPAERAAMDDVEIALSALRQECRDAVMSEAFDAILNAREGESRAP
jgi:hypothetical protein